MNKKIFYLILTSVLIITAAGCGSNQELENIAQCLSDEGVKEYGAFWCPNCADQATLFGSGDKIIKQNVYVECDARCVPTTEGKIPTACKGIMGNPDACDDAGITGYPTWVFPDGTRMSGVQEPTDLAKTAGCQI